MELRTRGKSAACGGSVTAEPPWLPLFTRGAVAAIKDLTAVTERIFVRITVALRSANLGSPARAEGAENALGLPHFPKSYCKTEKFVIK